MKFSDILILSAVVLWGVAAIWFMIRQRKRGKRICGCSGDCASCHAACVNATPPKQENK